MAEAEQSTQIVPQAAQEAFLRSSADIAIFGGGAGGGKTWALLVEPLRHVNNGRFGAVVFRRTFPQINSEGGLWDTAEEIYPGVGGRGSQGKKIGFRFPSGAQVSFSHLQYESDRLAWQGAQIPLICWDELTHFSWRQFSYLLSRNRSACGVRPYMRATCNPDPDHWLRGFLDWWIGDDGFPIRERSGAIRWMAIINNETHWADSREELIEQHGDWIEPLSVTFIQSLLEDNPALVAKDPGYRAKLKALPSHERDQLLGGNWDARPAAGTFFRREWFGMVNAAPAGAQWVRYWDRAATEPSSSSPDPDWTVGALVGRTPEGRTIIGDVVRFRGSPGKVRQAIANTAAQDGEDVLIGLEGEPGSSGKADAQHIAAQLQGYKVKINQARTRKEAMWSPVSSQAEAGNIDIVRGRWNDALMAELESIPDSAHDDQADAVSGAYMLLNAPRKRPMLG